MTDEKYYFRKGRDGDRCSSKYAGKRPTYVLFYDGVQVGAQHGAVNEIAFFEIFKQYRRKNHGTEFVKRLEEEAKRLGKTYMRAIEVECWIFERMLIKRGYKCIEKNEYPTYEKEL